MQAAVRFRIKGSRVYVAPHASSYEAAGGGRRAQAWRVSAAGPNAALQWAGPDLRNKSRDAARNNVHAKALIARVVSNMVGTGITPQCGDPATQKLFTRWTDQASADGTLDFYGLQAQAARAMVVGGECFVRLRNRRPEDGLVVPLQIQVLEAEHVPAELNRVEPNGNEIRQGIEFDKVGRRVAYWMYRSHPGDANLVQRPEDSEPVRVPASEVLHVYDAINRPGLIRGEPWLAGVLNKLRDLDLYDDAELKRKQTAALFAGFIKRTAPEAEPIAGEGAADEYGAAITSLQAGTMQVLMPGEEIEFSKPADVGGSYEVFIRQQLRSIAAAVGILYEQLTGDYGQLNDRTLRAALNEFRRLCELWQH